MSLSEPCLIHILGHHYHPTYQLQMLPFSHKLPLLRVYASFHQKLTLLFSNRNTGLVHHLSTNHSTLGPLGNHSEAYGMDINYPLGHLSSYYSVSTSLLTNRSNSLEYCTTTIILLWIISHIQWWINRINNRMNRINNRINRINNRMNRINNRINRINNRMNRINNRMNRINNRINKIT